MAECFFCQQLGGKLLYQNELLRIILVEDDYYYGYLRIILNRHVVEMTDIDFAEAQSIWKVIYRCEQLLRTHLNPDKINLASFGNLTPHLHWHIIPRFINDRHFPNPVWGEVTNLDYTPSADLWLKQQLLFDNFTELFSTVELN
ncbi:MAG: hypothetical protein RLZZ293_1401 [Pseudomonadota bacterium]|jgi:diadenosine tetraphosphate (Ap4A) HIT family hydrolase